MGPGDAFTSLFISQGGIFEYFFVGFPTETIEQLCAQIENAVEELGVPLSGGIIKQFFIKNLGNGFSAEIDTLIECLLKEGIIVDRETPDSISSTGLDSINVKCTGPICAKLEQQSADSPIVNHGKDSTTMSQGVGNSHELTAMEKITQLKTQWLNQLP